MSNYDTLAEKDLPGQTSDIEGRYEMNQRIENTKLADKSLPETESREKQYKYATLTKASTDFYNNRDVEKTNTELQRYLPHNSIIQELSNQNTVVFHNPNTKNTTIAFRGTDWTNRSDVSADFAIAKSSYAKDGRAMHPRFSEAEDAFLKTSDKFGKENITLSAQNSDYGLQGNLMFLLFYLIQDTLYMKK